MRAKRFFDAVGSALLLLILAPLMLLVSIAIALTMGCPVAFRQERMGWKGKPFRILKFRTMTDGRDDDGELLPDQRRLTALGRFMRESSLDELPQLVNVLLGEMSLVGPRPLLRLFVERCTPEERRRFEARPGISGLAQISGRRTLSYAERFERDVWYIDHWSLALDLRILLATAVVVLRRDGAKEQADAAKTGLLGLERQ